MLPKEETLTFEDRTYIKPEISRDEQTKFVENLRGVVDSNSQEVKTDTYNLGTAVPSNIGGLTGGEGYFDARYKTTQTGGALANLRAAAQASALNQAMANAQAAWEKRYSEAQRAYDKRVHDANKAPQTLDDGDDGEVDFEPTDQAQEVNVEENTLVLPENTSTDIGATNATNAIAGVTGQGKIPTQSSIGAVLIDKNGNRTAIKVHQGQGIEVAGGLSYTKKGAREFLQRWVRNGGRVSNGSDAPLHDNLSTNLIAWDLY